MSPVQEVEDENINAYEDERELDQDKLTTDKCEKIMTENLTYEEERSKNDPVLQSESNKESLFGEERSKESADGGNAGDTGTDATLKKETLRCNLRKRHP